ncbi:MAG: DUF2807 domain-containing protein [Bacteroidales bacterium]|jgi:hypothetical protein|nr:DUF2807 domain-containing protein [Bacteroidales bacterium]
MDRIFKIVLPVVILLLVYSCKDPNEETKTITGNENVKQETRHCADFSTVYVYDNFTVQIYKDDLYKLEMEGESNLLFYIEYDINKNGVLTLKVKDNYILNPTVPITIKIFTPGTPEVVLSNSSVIYYNEVTDTKCALSLRDNSKAYFTNSNIARLNITLSNQSSVESDGLIADIVDISTVTSSKIKMRTVEFNTATITSQSAGDAFFTGTCNNANLNIKNSGDIDAKDMTISNCTISIGSSGNIYAHVTNTLEGVINGSGNLYLKGNVNTDKVIIKSTGRIIPL